jgi:hypothetical protein
MDFDAELVELAGDETCRRILFKGGLRIGVDMAPPSRHVAMKGSDAIDCWPGHLREGNLSKILQMEFKVGLNLSPVLSWRGIWTRERARQHRGPPRTASHTFGIECRLSQFPECHPRSSLTGPELCPVVKLVEHRSRGETRPSAAIQYRSRVGQGATRCLVARGSSIPQRGRRHPPHRRRAARAE